jgi:hypothetical protein
MDAEDDDSEDEEESERVGEIEKSLKHEEKNEEEG